MTNALRDREHERPLRRPRRILDAHHHFWDLNAGHYPWLSDAIEPHFFLGNYTPLLRNFLPADYRAASRGYPVVGTVHVEAERNRNDQVGETRWLESLHREAGLPSAIVAHAWFHHADCEERLAAHMQCPLVRGIRSKPVTASTPDKRQRGLPGSMQDDAWLRGFALLDRYGLAWDLRVPWWHLAEAAEVARMFPDTPIMLNHAGFPWDRRPEGLHSWRGAMETLASCPNVTVKVSELGLRDAAWTVAGNRGVVDDTIRIFGIDRCMFASNWPVSTLRMSFGGIVDGLGEMLTDLDDEDFDKFFYANAARIYRVDAFPVFTNTMKENS